MFWIASLVISWSFGHTKYKFRRAGANFINLIKFGVILSGVEDLFHSRKQQYLSFDYALDDNIFCFRLKLMTLGQERSGNFVSLTMGFLPKHGAPKLNKPDRTEARSEA